LRQIGLEPHLVDAAEIDESFRDNETPRQLPLRLAALKAQVVAHRCGEAHVVAADTVVAVGRRILPKAETAEQVRDCLGLLSGRSHRVLTGVHVIAPDGARAYRLNESRVYFKRLTAAELDNYVGSGEGLGKAGGYGIQGHAARFVTRLQGSYSGVVGLPLYETANLLAGFGYPIL
jgi:septum formation protein